LASSLAIPAPRADDDPVRAAADSVLEPVRPLQRELGDHLVPRVGSKPLQVVDAAQAAERPGGTRDDRACGTGPGGNLEDEHAAAHGDIDGAAGRGERRPVTTGPARAGRDARNRDREAVDSQVVRAD